MNVFGYKTVCRSSINRPEKGDFSVFHFRISFSGRLPPENGDPLSDKVSYPNMASGLGFPNVMGGNKRVTSQHSSSCKYLSAEGAKRILKGTRAAAYVSRHPLAHTSGLTTSWWGRSDSDVDDYESRVTLLAVAIAAFAKHEAHTTCCRRGRGQPPSATSRC